MLTCTCGTQKMDELQFSEVGGCEALVSGFHKFLRFNVGRGGACIGVSHA